MRTVALFLLLAFSSAVFSQKTVYSAKFRLAGSNGKCDRVVKFGPDLKVRTDDPCATKEEWTLFDYRNPATEYLVWTEMKKLVFTKSPAGNPVQAHETVKELGDTTILGYKCKKLSVKFTEVSHLGFAKKSFESEYTYYITKELAYPQAYSGVAVTNLYFPVVPLDGVVLKGGYRILTPAQGGKAGQKWTDDQARNWSLLDLSFDKVDETQFATPQ